MKYTLCTVAKHKNDIDGYWIYINNKVYDLTLLCDVHPGDNIIKNAVKKNQNQKDLIKMHAHLHNIKSKINKYYIGKLTKCNDNTCQLCYTL